jgi:exosortase A-associated hydrolase 1
VAGKAYWTQFLRIRIAADMGQADGVKTTEQLRQRSAAGQVVETSGYLVGPDLARHLDTLAMPPGERLKGKQVCWFDVATTVDAAVPRASAKQADEWRAQGVRLTTAQVVGPSFWQVHERDVAPALVEATSSAVRAWDLPARTPRQPGPGTAQHPSPAAEYPVAFPCGDAELAGVIHRGASDAKLGVVIVVAGGPQFRVGAHRQFVSLARLFASKGYPVMRFDLRGMGDSSGDYLGYHHSRPDIRAALDELMRREPSLRQVALFGECESASGILFYASQDERVGRIALANPWVRTAEGQAEVILKHYYLDRLRSAEFWRNVLGGRFKWRDSLSSLLDVLRNYWQGRRSKRVGLSAEAAPDFDHLPLPAKTAEGLRRFRGSVLVLMSGRDYIAREFDEVTRSHEAWKGLLSDPRIRRKDIADADHTFSKPEAKAEAHGTLLEWLAQGGATSQP